MTKFQELLDKVKKLQLPADQYAIFGSGPLAIRKLRDSNDIDLIVKQELWENLAQKYPITDKYGGFIEIGEIEIFRTWGSWFSDVNKLIDDADIIEGVRFVKLKYVLQWKKNFNRDKDQKDIKIIETILNAENSTTLMSGGLQTNHLLTRGILACSKLGWAASKASMPPVRSEAKPSGVPEKSLFFCAY